MYKATKLFVVGWFFVSCFLFLAPKAQAASLSVSPTNGTFTVGSTFDVSVFLDTENESVNTISIFLKFSPDKLQLVSPSTGHSIIDTWLTPPRFNNMSGLVELKGGIPGGVNVDKGLITKLTFRVKGVGQGILRFLDDSKVLLNDGLGTEALRNTQNAVYSLELPPPAGPIVVSSTHSLQSTWYSNPNTALSWSYDKGVVGYSHVLNKEITDIPDEISEGTKNTATYKNLADGRHYFHVKSLRDGVWGGTTHFVVNVDTTPPADFPIEILPGKRTVKNSPIVKFSTTDNLSGIDHYELKIVPLGIPETEEDGVGMGAQSFFIDVESPYITPELELGDYDIIVRAYDKAGNYREVIQRLEVVSPVFKLIATEGIEIKGRVIVSWLWFWVFAVIVLAGLGYVAWHLKTWHLDIDKQKTKKKLPRDVQSKLKELKKYHKKYGSSLAVVLLMGSFFIASLLAPVSTIANSIEVGPPLISTISKNISNNEIFYTGGKTEASNTDVIIYIQSVQTGETISRKVVSDKRGDWFYRHDTFLLSGNYILWTQSQLGEELSPPSPQINIAVRATAIQFGSSRISFETFYLGAVIVLLLVLIGLVSYIVFHSFHFQKKRKHFIKEINEAEEAIRRGFAVLRRDIQQELSVVKKAKVDSALSSELKAKEEQLLRDLEEVERNIGKEVFDIEKTEYLEP